MELRERGRGRSIVGSVGSLLDRGEVEEGLNDVGSGEFGSSDIGRGELGSGWEVSDERVSRSLGGLVCFCDLKCAKTWVLSCFFGFLLLLLCGFIL